MKMAISLIFCFITTFNVFGQINEIFPYITLGMEYNDFKDKISYKSDGDSGFYFGDIKFGGTSGFGLSEVKRPKVQFINFMTLFGFFQNQGFHFYDDKLTGCFSALYFFPSMFDTGPPGYDFDEVHNELLVKLTGLFGDFTTVYDGPIDNESLHRIPPELQSGRTIPGRNYFYDYVTVKAVKINQDTLYLVLWKRVASLPDWESDIRIPKMYIFYGTDYFFNNFSDDFYAFGE